MPPILALILWFIFLVALFRFDPAKARNASFALWVPLIWMFFMGSRLPSQWLGTGAGLASDALQEGNLLDRIIFLIFILLAIVILNSRSFRWGQFFARNLILVAFLSFALMSVIWSDFSFVALKRWFRDLGNYLMILLVLTDPHPVEAIRSLLRRFSYLIIPLSILLFKYYPQIGMQYDPWFGTEEVVGATTTKNMLGVACLVSGIYFFWDILAQWPNRNEQRTRRTIAINIAFLMMTVWLLLRSNSATSRVCLLIGCTVIAVVHTEMGRRYLGFFRLLIPAGFCIYVVLAYGFGLNANLAQAVGRNPTLTDRTIIWDLLLGMKTSPLFGTGYESFWLGPRLQWVWQRYGTINEAHNGYLEIYLSLGIIGLLLIVGFLVASYRTIGGRLNPISSFGSLSLALWTMQLFYNITEAAFKFHLMWFVFLLGALALPAEAEDRLREPARFDNSCVTKQGFGVSSHGRKLAQVTPPISTSKPAVYPPGGVKHPR
jgi:exopolysaccharide production protein ExoQ